MGGQELILCLGHRAIWRSKRDRARRKKADQGMTQDISLQRHVTVPDPLRVSRCLSAPHLGPRIVFFSGGSALNDVSRQLKRFTHNSAHLITPFDSGGSSQELRKAFDMPAVGDLRSRLMALADETDLGQPDIFRLFSYRLPSKASGKALRREMTEILEGRHPLIKALSNPMRRLILTHLHHFADNVPDGFNYANASIGNLILAGGYLSNHRELEPALFLMSKMVDVRGIVRAVADVNLQIGVDLTDGRRVIGQRHMTGKEAAALDAPVARLFLTDGTSEVPAAKVPLPRRNQNLIARSDLICFPPGSFYSSVLANLLPAKTGRAIAQHGVPKVYVPSLGHDPECIGMTLADQVGALVDTLRNDAGGDCPPQRFVTHLLCDETIPARDRAAVAKRFDVQVIARPLADETGNKYVPENLCAALMSFS